MRSLVTWLYNAVLEVGGLMRLPFFLAISLCVSPAHAAVDYDAILHDRLVDVRELLDRRHAHRSMLTDKIERFSYRLGQLQAEREVAFDVLSDHRDLARAHERELDRLMPRLLPRLNRLDRMRKEGARTIAGIATMERNTDLEDRTRSRFQAAQSVSIEQMRRASTAVRLLRRVPNAMTATHRDVDFQIPLLATQASRLDMQQSQLQRRRDAAVRSLADLNVDIERLTAEEHRLARNMIARRLEARDGDDGEIGDSRTATALPNRRGLGKANIQGADLRGLALQQTQPTPVARPLSELRADSGLAAVSAAQRRNAALSAKSQTSAVLAAWTDPKASWTGDVASLQGALTNDGLAARVGPGRIDRGQPLVPSIETINYNMADGNSPGKRQEIVIAALPGQPVAVPLDGNVAFAGDFREVMVCS